MVRKKEEIKEVTAEEIYELYDDLNTEPQDEGENLETIEEEA